MCKLELRWVYNDQRKQTKDNMLPEYETIYNYTIRAITGDLMKALNSIIAIWYISHLYNITGYEIIWHSIKPYNRVWNWNLKKHTTCPFFNHGGRAWRQNRTREPPGCELNMNILKCV